MGGGPTSGPPGPRDCPRHRRSGRGGTGLAPAPARPPRPPNPAGSRGGRRPLPPPPRRRGRGGTGLARAPAGPRIAGNPGCLRGGPRLLPHRAKRSARDPGRSPGQDLGRQLHLHPVHGDMPAPDRWLFLTGEKGAIFRLTKEGFRLGVADPDDASEATRPRPWLELPAAWGSHGSKGLILHSPRLVVVDRRAKIRAYHRPDDEEALERLRRNVRLVLREGAKGGEGAPRLWGVVLV